MIRFDREELMQRDGSYVVSTATSSDGQRLYDVIVTKCKCDDQPGSACTQAVTVHYQANEINMEWRRDRVRIFIYLLFQLPFPFLCSRHVGHKMINCNKQYLCTLKNSFFRRLSRL